MKRQGRSEHGSGHGRRLACIGLFFSLTLPAAAQLAPPPAHVAPCDERGSRALFADLHELLPPLLEAHHAAAGDVDGDGDLDALAREGLSFSLARELAWGTLAKLGRPVELELRGAPGTPWVLFSARARSPRDLATPYGPWRLDPSSAIRAAGGRFCARGAEVLTFPVPADPVLLGQALFWQAAVGSPLRLTNLDVTRVFGF